jgi:WD40 repeat protein
LQFWDVASGKELLRLPTPPGYRGSSEYVSLPADWSAVYVPWEKRKVVNFEKNGKRDWRYEYQGEVLAFDGATGKPRPSLKPAAGHGVLRADVSPNGRTLVAVEQPSHGRNEVTEYRVVLWDMQKATSRPLGTGYAQVAFAPGSRRFALCLYTSDPQTGVLKLCDAGGAELATLATAKGEGFWSPKFSPDGKRLVVNQGEGRIDRPAVLRIWDLETRKEVAKFKSDGASPFRWFVFSPDGKKLAATDYRDRVRVWDTTTGGLLWERPMVGVASIWKVVFSPDGRQLAVGGTMKSDGDVSGDADREDLAQPRVFLFDLTRAAEPEVLICPRGWITSLAYSPDGSRLAIAGTGEVHLFDMTKK